MPTTFGILGIVKLPSVLIIFLNFETLALRVTVTDQQSLISPILLEMKKLVIFHICALPQLFVKFLKVGTTPPPP